MGDVPNQFGHLCIPPRSSLAFVCASITALHVPRAELPRSSSSNLANPHHLRREASMMREDQWPSISRLETRRQCLNEAKQGLGRVHGSQAAGQKEKPTKKFKGVRTERTAKK